MADNYLEKQMDAWRSGKTVIRKSNPSLDSLLRRLGEPASGGDAVKSAQLEAICRSAMLLECSRQFSFSCDEQKELIIIHGMSGSRQALLDLGQALLAIRLKAAELGLCCEIRMAADPAAASGGVSASVFIHK